MTQSDRNLIIRDKPCSDGGMSKASPVAASEAVTLYSNLRLAYGLLPVVSLLQGCGLAPEPGLELARIERFGLMDPAYTISIEQELTFLRYAIARFPRADFSLELAAAYRLRGFSVLGLAMQASASPLEMLRLIMRFPRLAWGLFDGRLSVEDAHLTVRFAPNPHLLEAEAFLLERDMACALVLFQEARGAAFPLVEVCFRHACAGAVQPYVDFFGCPVRFQASETRLSCRLSDATQALPYADPGMCSFYTAQCERMSRDMEQPFRYAQAVRERLQASTQMPDLARVAQTLFMTPRTLQRRLRAEQQSFSDILRSVRKQRVQALLQDPALSLQEIAQQLGFSDAVALSHAFKNWFGCAPQVYRKAQL